MHVIDWAASLLFRVTPRRRAIFPDGWGDEEQLALFSRLPTADEPLPAVTIDWDPAMPTGQIEIRQGRFLSPIADLLPVPVAQVPVEMVVPENPSGICVLLPAWNDHGFDQRRKLARLLASRNLGTVAFDVPLYGRRRLVAEPHPAIRSVADFALMGFGAVVEARALIGALAGGRVGVSGYSMGGNLAALVSATIAFPVATAALAASHSPGPVYLDGILNNGISWRALGGIDQRQRLRSVLGSATVLSHPPLPHHRRAVIVAATQDGFVPASATRDLARHWAGSEVRWVKAGHATLLWRHRPTLADAIVDAFARLETSASATT